MRGLHRVTGVVLTLGVSATGLLAEEPPKGSASCVACHLQIQEELFTEWKLDVHIKAGLGCVGCHGGNASPELGEDMEAAMSPDAGYRGRPDRLGVPVFCGTCHADAEFMKRFDPAARVDQLIEYRSSVHGKANAAGDPVPATCIDCHGVHGIRAVDANDSPVYAMNVPATCGTCHADAAKMAPYGVSTSTYADYLTSAHAQALLEREDVAAPACNDCHGNHGASPPGVESVANVCGQCHGRESGLFSDSFKRDVFDEMGASECVMCHGNHRVLHPTAEMFRSASAPATQGARIVADEPLAATVDGLEPGANASLEWETVLRPGFEADDPRYLHTVVVSDGEGKELLRLEATVRPGAGTGEDDVRTAATPELAAELTFSGLSGYPIKAGDALRYRLTLLAAGQTGTGALRVVDRPGAGVDPLRGSVCLQCHSPGDDCDQATERMYAELSKMDLELRQAEALLHEASQRGMDVGAQEFELNSAGRTASIETRALIHSFEPERLIARASDGMKVAAAATAAGQAALDEWQYRRVGLAVSLVLILLVSTGLFLKIRRIDHERRRMDHGPVLW